MTNEVLNLKNIKNFQSALLDNITPHAAKLLDKYKDEFLDIYEVELYDKDGPTSLKHKPTQKDLFEGKIFRGFTEIYLAFENLKNIEQIYIRRFPYSKSQITKDQNLQYHFENYLNEIYILITRLDSYLNTIIKAYRRDIDDEQIKKLKDFLRSTFGSIKDARGNHVHKRRYTDREFERIAFLKLLCTVDETFKPFYEDGYRKLRKEKIALIEKNNREIEKFLDHYFENLYSVVFDNKKKLKYPSGLR